jgi:hypothetical protein
MHSMTTISPRFLGVFAVFRRQKTYRLRSVEGRTPADLPLIFAATGKWPVNSWNPSVLKGRAARHRFQDLPVCDRPRLGNLHPRIGPAFTRVRTERMMPPVETGNLYPL